MTKVLIVEDEPMVAEAMSQFLENAGHEVVGIARDEVSAICETAAERPDLVLMDIRLAGAGDGIEAARKIPGRLSGQRRVRDGPCRSHHPDQSGRGSTGGVCDKAVFCPSAPRSREYRGD